MNKKILIIGPSWVGDMVMAQSLFMALKQQADTTLVVLAPAWTRPLLDRMPEVDQSIPMPVGHGQLGLSTRWKLGRALRAQNFKQAIILPSSLKAALIPFFARIKKRTGFVGEQRYGLLNDIRKLDKKKLPLNVQRFVALSVDEADEMNTGMPAKSSQPKLRVDPQNQLIALDRLKLSTEKPILALCPGAEYGPAKQWPAAHFASLAKHFLALGTNVWIFGSDKDRAVAEEINQKADGGCRLLAGETSLGEVVDLMACADGVVSNDSGLMHIAAALDCNLAALYGSSSPDFTPPLSSRAKVIHTEISCRPCFKRVCPLDHTRCLEDLSPKQVIQSLGPRL